MGNAVRTPGGIKKGAILLKSGRQYAQGSGDELKTFNLYTFSQKTSFLIVYAYGYKKDWGTYGAPTISVSNSESVTSATLKHDHDDYSDYACAVIMQGVANAGSVVTLSLRMIGSGTNYINTPYNIYEV